MVIIHSFQVPFVISDKSGRYIFVDGKRTDLPSKSDKKDYIWFRRPYPGGKNEAFKIHLDWEVKGNAGRSYKVEVDHNKWSCNCHSFKFSGNKKFCKHIEEIKTSYL